MTQRIYRQGIEVKTMNMNEVKQIARSRGLNPGRMKKADLIRTMQREEGNESCFQTGQADVCDQSECLWREDCLK
jgi:hypothetical protein